MARSVDVESYFRRIGYAGSRAATLETLRSIHLLHPQAIAFENLDPLLRRPISLESSALQQKLLHSARGGWCFEHNWLLADALESLGFRVARLAARVMWNAAAGPVRPRTHMLLRIDGLEGGPHIADVGFGGLTLTGPLRLVASLEQATPHEPFRLMEVPEGYVLEVLIGDSWKPLYSFDLQPQMLPDYEVWNWYLEQHPASPFVNNLMVARVAADRRYALMNNKLSVHPLRGESEQTTLTTSAELRRVLTETFGIRLPEDPKLEQVLARFTGSAGS